MTGSPAASPEPVVDPDPSPAGGPPAISGRYRPVVLLGLAVAVGVFIAAVTLAVMGAGSPHATGGRSPAAAGAASRQPAPPTAALRALVRRYGRAVVSHDRRLLAGTLDPRARRFRSAALTWLADTRYVPFADWWLTLGPPSPAGAGRVRAPGSLLRYRIAGFDARPVTQPVDPVFSRRAGRWTVTALVADRPDGLPAPTELWDLEPVRAVRAPGVLVLGSAGQLVRMQQLAAIATAAIPRVTAVWGPHWPRRAVLEVPDSQRQLGRITGFDGPLGPVAAVTDAEIHTFGPADPAGDRIAINPGAWDQLSPTGQSVVVTHELTHVATRASTRANTPKWLSEGFAEWVSFRDSGVPVAVAATALRAQVMAGRLPGRLPPDSDFTGGRARLDRAYDEAWLACAAIADRWGKSALVGFYRAAGTSRRSPSAAVRVALRRVLHTTPDGFIRTWHHRLTADLG